ncbi:threonine/serine ThrE exporter family protein [Ornithinimicrobium kibberense]|uniref:Threonine/serine exporter ThrE family protein n=1 Tax=Ornithinimicrobium kibberense TaxID=282060 RepID=A0ABV5V095_9MICO|nr:threonine/serine exporter family protein [Ornithinimicrobium kibberense]
MSEKVVPEVVGGVTGPQQVNPHAVRPAGRVGRVWRQRASEVVRSASPPTLALGTRLGGDEAVSQRQARAVIDLALRVGEAMLSTGASAADCVASVLRLMTAYGVRSAHIDVTFTSITVSIHRGLHEDPLSVMRVIPGRAPDYSRLEGVQGLLDDIVASAEDGDEAMPIDVARARLTRVLESPHPYQRWVVTVGFALLAVGVVMLFGAAPGMWVAAALSAALVDRVQRVLYTTGVAAFFTQAVSAAVPTTIALGLHWLASVDMPVPGVRSPSLVVISGIVVLLAGLGVMGAAQDALDGYFVTAGARGMEVLLMTAGIAVGVAVVIGTANRFGVDMEVSPFVALGGNPLLGVVGAMLVALGFCLSTYTGPRTTLVSMAVAAGGWVVFEVGLALGLGGPEATAVASAPVGVAAYAVHRRLRMPELAVGTAGIVSMLPGLAVYRAIYLILSDSAAVVGNAVLHFVTAVSTGMALAAGLSIGGFLARRRLGLDRAAQRARRRSRGRYVGD